MLMLVELESWKVSQMQSLKLICLMTNQYATGWYWSVGHPLATWLSQRTNCLSLVSGGRFGLQWYLSFGSQKVAKVQLVLYLITLLKTMLLLLFFLIVLLLKGIAYGTRHIVQHCNAHGHKIDTLLACGGLAKNSVYIQEHADIIGCPIILPRENESVLLGAAVLGAVAGKKFPGIRDAMKALNAAGKVVKPSSDPRVKKYHDAKYQIFRSLYEQQLSHRSTMAQALQ